MGYCGLLFVMQFGMDLKSHEQLPTTLILRIRGIIGHGTILAIARALGELLWLETTLENQRESQQNPLLTALLLTGEKN